MNMKNYFWMMAFSIALMFQASSSVATAQEVGGGAVAVDPVIADSAQAAVQKLGIEMMKDNFQYGINNMYPRWKRRLAKRMGGEDKLDAALAKSLQQQVKLKMKVVGYQAGKPTTFFSVWKAKKIDPRTGKPALDATGRERIVSHWLAIVPTVVRIRIPDPQRGGLMREIEEKSYTTVVSEKGTNQWHFMTNMKPTVKDLRGLFPSLPVDESAFNFPPSSAREIK